ncbi:MAG: peptidylprolyl isomerase, partial [Pirellulaceae bacterium]
MSRSRCRSLSAPLQTLALCAVSLFGTIAYAAPQDQAPSTGQPAADQQMQIMAVVNGQQITRQHLLQESARRFGEPVIESMINNRLISIQCQAEGIAVTDADIDAEIQRRATKFGMSSPKYVELICSERDLTPRKLRSEIIWTELALRRLASSMTQVSNEDVQMQLQSEFGAKVQVRAIALDSPEKAQQILTQARANPEQFSRLAIDHSVDPNSASVGGLLPPLRRNMGEPDLENAAFALEVGQVSDVIQLSGQFIIIKCERHYQATELPPEQQTLAEERIREEIRESRLGDAAAQLFQQMQENSEIVNVFNNPELRQQMPGVAATINGHQITLQQVYEECLARFGRDVLQSEINRSLIMQKLQQVGESVVDADLQQEIRRAAIEFGITQADGSADMEKWIQYVTQGDSSRVEIYVQDEVWPTVAMKKIVARNVQVTEEDMQKGFEANFGPRVEALAIVLSDQRTAQRVWEMAKANQTEKYFGELAHQYSIEPASRAHYGEVPPIQKHGGRQMLEEEAFRLEPGAISGLVPVGQNWV